MGCGDGGATIADSELFSALYRSGRRITMATTPSWVAANADGRLELFIPGAEIQNNQFTNVQLFHKWQTAPSNGWSDWASLGTPTPNLLIGNPTVAANADRRLEFFVVDEDGEMWHRWQTAPNNGWSQWASFGTPGTKLTDRPAVAANADGALQLFVVDQNGQLWHRWQTAPNNGWSNWTSFSNPPGVEQLNSPPVVAPKADGTLALFIAGQDQALWYLYQTAPNNGWEGFVPLGNPPVLGLGSLTVATNADGRLEVFAGTVIGGAGRPGLWHQWQTASGTDGWSDWEPFDNPPGTQTQLVTPPAVGPSADGRLELFLVGSDEALYHRWQTAPSNGWSGWSPMGTPKPGLGVPTIPALAPSADGRLELFIQGTDGALWHQWQTAPSNGWSGWSSLGSPPGFTLLAAFKG